MLLPSSARTARAAVAGATLTPDRLEAAANRGRATAQPAAEERHVVASAPEKTLSRTKMTPPISIQVHQPENMRDSLLLEHSNRPGLAGYDRQDTRVPATGARRMRADSGPRRTGKASASQVVVALAIRIPNTSTRPA